MATTAETFGARLKRLRTAAGLTQEELRQRSGVSRPYISELETNKHPRPGNGVVIQLATGLEVDYHVLVDGLDPSNVAGLVEDVQAPVHLQYPVYRWGSCGDPTDLEQAPVPDHYAPAPTGKESLVSPQGFGVIIRGESMARRRIHDGDIVWVRPGWHYRLNSVVLALVSKSGQFENRMVIKTFRRAHGLPEGLWSQPESGDEPVDCDSYKVIGPVVWIQPGGYPPEG